MVSSLGLGGWGLLVCLPRCLPFSLWVTSALPSPFCRRFARKKKKLVPVLLVLAASGIALSSVLALASWHAAVVCTRAGFSVSALGWDCRSLQQSRWFVVLALVLSCGSTRIWFKVGRGRPRNWIGKCGYGTCREYW